MLIIKGTYFKRERERGREREKERERERERQRRERDREINCYVNFSNTKIYKDLYVNIFLIIYLCTAIYFLHTITNSNVYFVPKNRF